MAGPRLVPNSRRRSTERRAALVAVAAAAAIATPSCGSCRDHDPPPVPALRDAAPARRVIVPAAGDLRPLPPHAIRADGVGPYRLGAPLDTVLAQLPSGPRVALLDLQGVVDVSVVRAEDDGVLVGGESVSASAAYVAVVRADVARTESGVGVGSTRAELDAALGPLLVDAHVLRDPRLVAYASLPNARFVLANDRVIGVLLRRREPATTLVPPLAPPHEIRDAGREPPHEAAADAPCGAGPRRDAALAVAGLRTPPPLQLLPACLDVAGEVVAIGAEAVAVIAGEGDRARRLAALEVRGLRFAGAVRVDPSRDELVTVSGAATDDEQVLTVVVHRLDAGKLVRTAEQDVYRIRANSAGWIGARLSDLDLLLEIEGRPDAVVVSGALIHTEGGVVRDLAPLEPVRLARRRKASPADAPAAAIDADAGVPASEPAHDAAPP